MRPIRRLNDHIFASVQLDIYNVNGQLVRSLVNETRTPGSYTLSWDGKDNLGRSVSSGVYLVRLESSGFVYSEKMVLTK